MNMRYPCIHACENAQGVKTAMRTAVHRTSGFSASAETVFSELQKLQTLQKVAAPWASFVQVQPNQDLVPLWNHEIILSAEDEKHCLYTDHVELDAGWKTPAVWL